MCTIDSPHRKTHSHFYNDTIEFAQAGYFPNDLILHFRYNIEKDIAAYIKKEFDKKYNPTWHCIVGRNFGSYVTHETKHFIYFYLGQVAILLFKSG